MPTRSSIINNRLGLDVEVKGDVGGVGQTRFLGAIAHGVGNVAENVVFEAILEPANPGVLILEGSHGQFCSPPGTRRYWPHSPVPPGDPALVSADHTGARTSSCA